MKIARIKLLPKTTTKGVVSLTGDTANDIRRKAQTFNSFVHPGEGAIYGEHAIAIHGLHASHPSIRDAEESMLCGICFASGSGSMWPLMKLLFSLHTTARHVT